MEEKNKCPHCKEREVEAKEKEEVKLALLLAGVPLLVTTLFSQMRLL